LFFVFFFFFFFFFSVKPYVVFPQIQGPPSVTARRPTVLYGPLNHIIPVRNTEGSPVGTLRQATLPPGLSPFPLPRLFNSLSAGTSFIPFPPGTTLPQGSGPPSRKRPKPFPSPFSSFPSFLFGVPLSLPEAVIQGGSFFFFFLF